MTNRTEKWLHCMQADGSSCSPNPLHLVKLDTWIREYLILRYFDTWISDTFDQRLRRPQRTSLLPPTYNYCSPSPATQLPFPVLQLHHHHASTTTTTTSTEDGFSKLQIAKERKVCADNGLPFCLPLPPTGTDVHPLLLLPLLLCPFLRPVLYYYFY